MALVVVFLAGGKGGGPFRTHQMVQGKYRVLPIERAAANAATPRSKARVVRDLDAAPRTMPELRVHLGGLADL